jgi:hypothetical protein
VADLHILFLTRNGEGYVGAPNTQYEFEHTVAKYADCKWAGEGYPLYIPNETIDETVQRVMSDADWVIDKDNNLHTPKPRNRRYKIGVFLSDLHGKHYYKIETPMEFADLINFAKYDAVFMRYLTVDGVTNCDPGIILQRVRCNKYWVPWSIDPNKFKPHRPYNYDVAFIGRISKCYPLRQRIWDNLTCITEDYRVLQRQSPSGKTYQRSWETLKETHLVGEKYTETLGSTKILLFGCSKYRYPLQKFFEGAASGCLVMSNAFRDAEKLGFVDGETFIDINIGNWEDRLLYYLENIDECANIANSGYKNVMVNHTHDVRAKHFVEILENE